MQSDEKNIAIIVPVYNCFEQLGALLPLLRNTGFPVIIVDDGSDTGNVALPDEPQVCYIRHEKNKGKGAALKTGFSYAIEQGFSGVFTIDGDLQHHPGDIIHFLPYVTTHDLIIGKRDFTDKSMPLHRKMSNMITSAIFSKTLNVQIDDAQCGYRYISASLLTAFSWTSERYDLENEMLINAVRYKFPVCFVPVRTIYNDSISHMNCFTDTWRIVWAYFKYSYFKNSGWKGTKDERRKNAVN